LRLRLSLFPSCPVYQNVTATAVSSPEEIKKNLIVQLTAPVKWTQSQQMIADGATLFTEVGPISWFDCEN
jgi:[acyl-carrier-protein] S-malonyltransferase